ncbi:MAG: alpha,alpha-trehalose-phosphate synthase (UDP-forming) [Rhizomicrobium sp.]
MARICILSNRVSVPTTGRAVHPGGLEVALRALLKKHRCVWMGWSGKAVDDPAKMSVHRSSANGTDYVVTDLHTRDFEEYYNGFANRVLWPVLHYRQDLAEFSRRDLSGYLRVNDRFADLLIGNLQPDDLVWVHDYHLMPLAKVLRARGFTNRIGFFLHIPMPPPEVVAAMPHHDQVLGALAEYDLVGFQTETDTVNFARYIAQQFGSSPHLGTIPRGLRVGTFPVGIETAEFQRMAQLGERSETVRRLAATGLKLVVGVDRLDYSKGLGLKFEAFEHVLKARPEWAGTVTFLQITPKSRSAIAEYAAMEQELDTLSGRINADYGDVLWTPIRFVTRAYGRDQLAGLFRIARVGVVTPLRDGMNLVAKEYVAAQNPNDPGVLVLSEFAGAAAELRAALLVNPNDPEAVSQATQQALSMPLQERRDRHQQLMAALARTDISKWGASFIAKLTNGNGLSRPEVIAAE